MSSLAAALREHRLVGVSVLAAAVLVGSAAGVATAARSAYRRGWRTGEVLTEAAVSKRFSYGGAAYREIEDEVLSEVISACRYAATDIMASRPGRSNGLAVIEVEYRPSWDDPDTKVPTVVQIVTMTPGKEYSWDTDGIWTRSRW